MPSAPTSAAESTSVADIPANAQSFARQLGRKGRLTSTGLAQMLKRRARQAGIPEIHPHCFGTPSPINGSPKAAVRVI